MGYGWTVGAVVGDVSASEWSVFRYGGEDGRRVGKREVGREGGGWGVV